MTQKSLMVHINEKPMPSKLANMINLIRLYYISLPPIIDPSEIPKFAAVFKIVNLLLLSSQKFKGSSGHMFIWTESWSMH